MSSVTDHTINQATGVLVRNGHTNAEAARIIDELADLGLLFETSGDPVAEEKSDASIDVTVNTGPELKEWIEHQEGERRAWAITTAIDHMTTWNNVRKDDVVKLAREIEEFVKGPEKEDPDLHDQDALDQFYALYAEDAQNGVEFMRVAYIDGPDGRAIPFPAPTDEDVAQAAENLLDKMSMSGIRLKNGEKFERLLEPGEIGNV